MVSKIKPKVVGVLFTHFEIGTTRPVSFLKDLKKLCNKYAVKIKKDKLYKGSRDFEFGWEITSD